MGRCRYGDTSRRRYADRRFWIPTLLTRLNAPAFKPEVDMCRVGYVGAPNQGTPSSMTITELQALAESFPWPKGIRLRLPCYNGLSRAHYPGCIVVYEEFLKVGFRLPLHPFIGDFLSEIGLCPAELDPNAWRAILAFLLKCKDLNLVPSYEAFKSICSLSVLDGGGYTISFPKLNLVSNSKCAKMWDTKWFLVCKSGYSRFDFPMYPENCHRVTRGNTVNLIIRWNTIRNEDREQVLIFESLPRSWATGPIRIKQLEEAGLSLPHPRKGKRKNGCVGVKSEQMELLNKKAKNRLTHLMDSEEDEEEESDSDNDEEENDSGDSEEGNDSEDEEKENDSEEEEEEEEEELEEENDSDDELANTSTHDVIDEDAPVNSDHVGREEGVLRADISLEGGSQGTSTISTLCRPEVSAALRQLPEIISAAQGAKELERQLDESRREIVELKKKNATLQSRIECLEEEKDKLEEVTQKAREFIEISSSLLKVKN